MSAVTNDGYMMSMLTAVNAQNQKLFINLVSSFRESFSVTLSLSAHVMRSIFDPLSHAVASLRLRKTDGVTFFSWKTDDLFSHRPAGNCHHSHGGGGRLSSVLINSSPKIFRLSLECHPLDGITQGGPPPAPPFSDAIALSTFSHTP